MKLIEAKLPTTTDLKYTSTVFAKKFAKYQEALVVKLSNGVLQFFWKDGGLSLRGYKWITYRLKEVQGEGAIFGTYPETIDEKVQQVRHFLKEFSEKRLTARKTSG